MMNTLTKWLLYLQSLCLGAGLQLKWYRHTTLSVNNPDTWQKLLIICLVDWVFVIGRVTCSE